MIVNGIVSLNIGSLSILLLGFGAAVLSLFSSSLAINLALLPIGYLLTQSMGIPALFPALAITVVICSKFTDISAFSSSGALMLAAHQTMEPDDKTLFTYLMRYADILCFAVPLLCYFLFVVLRLV
jgi:di/tricarboxylate transporter